MRLTGRFAWSNREQEQIVKHQSTLASPVHVAGILVPPPVATPRGAIWAAAVGAWILRAGAATWRALERQGRIRASRHLNDLAARYQDTRPELARQMRQANAFIGRP
jgi:hypothetical protein